MHPLGWRAVSRNSFANSMCTSWVGKSFRATVPQTRYTPLGLACCYARQFREIRVHPLYCRAVPRNSSANGWVGGRVGGWVGGCGGWALGASFGKLYFQTPKMLFFVPRFRKLDVHPLGLRVVSRNSFANSMCTLGLASCFAQQFRKIAGHPWGRRAVSCNSSANWMCTPWADEPFHATISQTRCAPVGLASRFATEHRGRQKQADKH